MPFHAQAVKQNRIRFKFRFNLFSSLSIPFLLVLLLFVLLPFFFIVFYSFARTTDSRLYLTLDNFANFVSDVDFLKSLGLSLWFAFLTTIFTLLIGYPVAYFMAKSSPKVRNIINILITFPMWINMLLRTIAWKQILDDNGPIISLLKMIGLNNVHIIGTDFAVVLGLVYVYLPFVIIPIYTGLVKIENSLLEASMDLGANRHKSFVKVTLPLSIPGVISGITMVFLPAATTLVIPKYLGGGLARYRLIGNLIEDYFLKANNYYAGSAIAVVLAIVILFMIYLVNKCDRTVVKEKKNHKGKKLTVGNWGLKHE